MKMVGLALAFVVGAGSVIVAGVMLVGGQARVAEVQLQQRVQTEAKADSLQRATSAVADIGTSDSDAYRNARIALALAPVIFAQPSGAAMPLTSDDDAKAEDASPVKDANKDIKSDWRSANASANAADLESDRPTERPRPVRTARARKPATHTAQQDAGRNRPTCIQPTGFNGFLASLNLKPHCEIGAGDARPAG